MLSSFFLAYIHLGLLRLCRAQETDESMIPDSPFHRRRPCACFLDSVQHQILPAGAEVDKLPKN